MTEGYAIGITGVGAVTPAGWGVPAMLKCLRHGAPLESNSFQAQGMQKKYRLRSVPKPDNLLTLFRNPRLRRTSPVSRYLAAAAFEAMEGRSLDDFHQKGTRLGVVVSCFTGCVNYSQRFYGEVLDDPSTASPIVFPETVFNAPSSHLSALLGSSEMNYTLLGDDAQFLAALELGTQWLLDDEVDAVLVAAAEESNWLIAEGLSMFTRSPIVGEGAAAILLEPCRSPEVKVELITDSLIYKTRDSRQETLLAMRSQLPDANTTDILFESINEGTLWEDFRGPRINVREILGEGFGVSVAWSCAAAAGLLGSREFNSALVSGSGMDQSCAAMILSGH